MSFCLSEKCQLPPDKTGNEAMSGKSRRYQHVFDAPFTPKGIVALSLYLLNKLLLCEHQRILQIMIFSHIKYISADDPRLVNIYDVEICDTLIRSVQKAEVGHAHHPLRQKGQRARQLYCRPPPKASLVFSPQKRKVHRPSPWYRETGWVIGMKWVTGFCLQAALYYKDRPRLGARMTSPRDRSHTELLSTFDLSTR
jgi:hypothetical protein